MQYVWNLILPCVRDSSGNTFLRHEKKIAADSPARRGGHAIKKSILTTNDFIKIAKQF
jgi:hypothetical protein